MQGDSRSTYPRNQSIFENISDFLSCDKRDNNENNHDRSKIIELRITNDTLQKENLAKDREIRKLTKELQQYELTLVKLRNEMAEGNYSASEISKKDAEVMAGMCCTGTECGDLEPVKDVVGELDKYRERMQKMELTLKSSGSKVRAVQKINLGLLEEVSSLRRLCVAVDLERRDARLQLDLEGQIVKQMVKQLRQVKAKLQQKELESDTDFVSGDHDFRKSSASIPVACIMQPRARHRSLNIPLDSGEDFRSPSDANGDGDGLLSRKACEVARQPYSPHEKKKKVQPCELRTSTPEGSEEILCNDTEVLVVSNKPTTLINVSDTSLLLEDEIQEVCDCTGASVNLDSLDGINPRTPIKRNNTSDHPITNKIVSEQSSIISNTQSPCNNSGSPEGSSHNLEKAIKKSVQIQMPQMAHESETCDISQVSSEECATSCAGVQSPEKMDRSEEVNERCFDDVSDVECLCKNLECLRLDETSHLKDKAVNVRMGMKKDSGGGSSCAGVCEQYYRNKLMATLQILQNKEETIRVQGSSLGVAEARIAALTERACALRCELDAKARELAKLRKFAESCRVEKTDISATADMQEVENQKSIVNTLQDNLSIITELYRECFYETAKQEELIDLLRKSYLDVRLMEKDKSEKINRLQNVIDTQKWSIEQCQDVVLEVENLKSEISCFLNNSNNDSGMWERGSESPDVSEELGDILDQLRQLRDLLNGDCTCGLEDENKALKAKNEDLEIQLEKLRGKVGELETAVTNKDLLDQQYQKEMANKEREFEEIRKKLLEVECGNKERSASCETLNRQLQQAQVLVNDKSAELERCRQERQALEAANRQLQKELDKADHVVKEGMKKLMENTEWKDQLDESRSQVAALELQLRRVRARCRDLEECCRERQAQLQEAQARGAALCAESRRVTACVRSWMRRQRALAREQQEKIKMQEAMLAELQRCVEARQPHSPRPSATELCCSNYQQCPGRSSVSFHQPMDSSGTYSCAPVPRSVQRESETASCSKCASNRRELRQRSSESEIASCSSAPAPPRRRKRVPCCGNIRCPCAPLLSPAEQVVERVEALHAALAAGQRRWARARR